MKPKETLFFNSCFGSPRWERLNYIHQTILKLEEYLSKKNIPIPSPEAQKYLESIIKHYKISPQEIWEYFQKRNKWFFLEKSIRDFRELEIYHTSDTSRIISIVKWKSQKIIDITSVRKNLEIQSAIQKKKKQEEDLSWWIITVLWIKYGWDDKKFFIEKFKEKKSRKPNSDTELAHFVADTPSLIQALNKNKIQKK